MKGEQDEAITECREAIRLKQDDVAAHCSLGRALAAKGRPNEAITVLQEGIRLAPKNAEVHNELAWLLATCLDAKLRDPGRAVALAKKAIKLAPNNEIIWNTLGVAQFRAGAWNDAIVALEKSMEVRHGGDANDWFFLAMAHSRLHHQEEARKWFDQSVEWMEKNAPQDRDLLRFRAEATELLTVKNRP